MKTLTLWLHAVCLTVGVMLFAFGASRMLSGPVQRVADLLKHAPVQVVTVDP